MQILNKYSIFGSLILIIIAATSLYISDYRVLLESNPTKAAILMGYADNNNLDFITRGYNWDAKREVIRWHYDNTYFTLYVNSLIAAKSSWQVKTKGGTLQKRSYVAGTELTYADAGEYFSINRKSNYQNKHVLIETQTFSNDIVVANFPENYYVNFVPSDTKSYELIWKIEN